ncbi:(2Fe-2S)-binding protein [Falsiroseomonas sp.]|uniref:(2Fe-2S)-binding protein n=1 Tax=Falsiroseomonas sp. TaxID=2870721 RepID=UPI003F71C5D3
MFLCLCNALTDTQIAEAIHQGARRPREVHARCGCRAQCGRCTTSIVKALRASVATPPGHPTKQDR